MKRTVWEKLGDFVLGKGFYIVLFLCVATIGISGYYLIRAAVPSTQSELEPVAGDAEMTLPETERSTAAEADPVPAQEDEDDPEPLAVKPQETAGVEEETTQEELVSALTQAVPVYTWPVKGEVLRGYSLEVLAYDETMGDWRTHSGVDIAADEGIKVLCTSDGTVQAVYQDGLMGTTVEVDHGSGLVSVYSNLGDTLSVTVGQAVETGTVLGTVGSSAIAENQSASHLHFEMVQDGRAVDPVNFLP